MSIPELSALLGLIAFLTGVPIGVVTWLDKRLDEKLAPIQNTVDKLKTNVGSNGGSTVFQQIGELRAEVGVLSRQTSDSQFLAQTRRVLFPPGREIPDLNTFVDVLNHLEQRQLEELDAEAAHTRVRKPHGSAQ